MIGYKYELLRVASVQLVKIDKLPAEVAHIVRGDDLERYNAVKGANYFQTRQSMAEVVIGHSGILFPVVFENNQWQRAAYLPLECEVIVGRAGSTGMEKAIHSVIELLNQSMQPSAAQDRDLIDCEYGFGYRTDGDIGKGYH